MLTTLLTPNDPAGQQMPWVETIPSYLIVVPATAVANQVYATRVRVGRAVTVTTMTIYVGTASGNVDLGIYTSADNGVTLTRVGSTGSTAVAGASANQTISLTTPVTLLPGVDYYLAAAVDNGVASFGQFQTTVAPATALGNLTLTKTASFPLPASLATLTAGATTLRWVRAA